MCTERQPCWADDKHAIDGAAGYFNPAGIQSIMTTGMEIGQVVAERIMVFLRHTGEREAASLRVGLPVKIDDGTWCCPYELRTGSGVRTRGIYGVDAIQALELTMKMLPAEVDSWESQQNGKFHFLDDEGAGI